MPGNPQIQVTGKMSLYLRSPCSGANWRRKNTITHPWQLLWWCPRLGRSEVCWWHGRHRSQGWRGGKLLVLWPHLHQKGGRQQEVQPRWRWRVQSRKGARLRDSWRRGNCMTAGLRGYSLHPGQLLLWTESESSEEEVRDRGGSASHNQGNLDTHTLNWQTISSQSSFPGSFNYSLHTDSTFWIISFLIVTWSFMISAYCHRWAAGAFVVRTQEQTWKRQNLCITKSESFISPKI